MLIALLLACHPDRGDGSALEVDAALGSIIPNVLDVSWESPVAGEAWVEWGLDGSMDHSSVVMSVQAGEWVALDVLGPPSGETVTLRAVVVGADGERLLSEEQTLTVPLQPAEIPAVYAEGYPSGAGWLFTTLIAESASYVVILDEEARLVWYHPLLTGQLVTSAEPREDGQGVIAMAEQPTDRGPMSVLTDITWGGAVRTQMHLPDGHHDFAQLPDGRVAWLQLQPGLIQVDGEPLDVVSDSLRISAWAPEADMSQPPGFSRLEHGPEPTTLCSDQRREVYLRDIPLLDWSHANSLSYDPVADQILVLSHYIDDVMVLSGDTGTLQRIIAFPEGDPEQDEGEPWSHAHASQMSTEHMLLFDNGLHYDPPRSRVVGYTVDPVTGLLTQTQSIAEPRGRVVYALGDARTLPWGNTLISWSTLGSITEQTDDGEVLWSLSTPIGVGTGRLRWLEQLY